MILYPAIDLKDGACVRLVRGEMDQATVFNDDPAAQAKDFEEAVKSLPLTGDGWQPTLDWLIKNGHNIYRLLEGDFDWRNKDDPAADRLAKKRRENAYKQRQEHEARQKEERERMAKRSRQAIAKTVGQGSLISEPPKAEAEQRTQREIEEALRHA